MTPGMRRLGVPRAASVKADSGGLPTSLGRSQVESIAEEWVVEDRWWTGRPVRRRYFEVVLSEGRNSVVFRDLGSGRWFTQRG